MYFWLEYTGCWSQTKDGRVSQTQTTANSVVTTYSTLFGVTSVQEHPHNAVYLSL